MTHWIAWIGHGAGKSWKAITSVAKDAAGNIYGVGYEGMIYRIDFPAAQFE